MRQPTRGDAISLGVTTRAVLDDELDIRLDRWFRRHYPALTQGAIQKMCRTGQVRVDGRRVEGATRLAPGQSVRIPPLRLDPLPETEGRQPADPKARQELDAMLLFEDEFLFVLNKPAGLPSQGGQGIARHLDGMLEAWRGPGRQTAPRPPAGPRHDGRAGRRPDVRSGRQACLGLPLPQGWRRPTGRWWRVGRCRSRDRVDLPLVRIEGQGGERVGVAQPGDKASRRWPITDYRTLDHAARKLAWLELRPLTGRTHQLRVHCAALGAPILGDYAYGERRENNRNSAIVDGLSEHLHLHARRLVLPHPAGGMLSVEAALPGHMAESFRALGFAAPAPLAATHR